MSYVLRSFGFNSSMLLQHQKLRIQKTLGTADKVYKSDTTRPPVSELIDDIFPDMTNITFLLPCSQTSLLSDNLRLSDFQILSDILRHIKTRHL